MEKNLEFVGNSITVEQFKTKMSTSKINVIINPNTNKLFMADDAGNSLGGVSTNVKTLADLKNPVISMVRKPDTNEVFALLHNKGEGSSQPVFSL